MERYRFGKGDYKYFRYPLPEVVERVRTATYPHLAKIANRWLSELGSTEKSVRGTKGNYRVSLRHGLSRVRRGTRFTLGIIYHDAK